MGREVVLTCVCFIREFQKVNACGQWLHATPERNECPVLERKDVDDVKNSRIRLSRAMAERTIRSLSFAR